MDKFYVCWKKNQPGQKWEQSYDFHTRGGALEYARQQMFLALERKRYGVTDYEKLQVQSNKLYQSDIPVQFCGYLFKIKVVVGE